MNEQNLEETKKQLGETMFSELKRYIDQSEAKITGFYSSFSIQDVKLKINSEITHEAQIKKFIEDNQKVILEINPLKFWLKCPFHRKMIISHELIHLWIGNDLSTPTDGSLRDKIWKWQEEIVKTWGNIGLEKGDVEEFIVHLTTAKLWDLEPKDYCLQIGCPELFGRLRVLELWSGHSLEEINRQLPKPEIAIPFIIPEN